jgi:hypothetical protein
MNAWRSSSCHLNFISDGTMSTPKLQHNSAVTFSRTEMGLEQQHLRAGAKGGGKKSLHGLIKQVLRKIAGAAVSRHSQAQAHLISSSTTMETATIWLAVPAMKTQLISAMDRTCTSSSLQPH